MTELPALADGQRERVDAAIFAEGGTLRLRWTPRRHLVPFSARPAAQETTLLPGVTALDIAYSGGDGWTTTWSAERLPALVRLKLVFAADARHWPPIIVRLVREPLQQ